MASSIGTLEEQILIAINTLGPDVDSSAIIDLIRRATGERMSPGALYTTLGRLEDRGLITSIWSDPRPMKGGRARRLSTITDVGKIALESAESIRRNLRSI